MPSFQYRARDKEGALITGKIDAVSLPEVETNLDRMGLIPIRIGGESEAARFVSLLKTPFQKITPQDVILFSRQLATLFGAGVPLLKALNTLEKQAISTAFAEVIKEIRLYVEGGGTLSAAIARHPSVFPEFFPHMIEAGEAGGILDAVLERMATMLEKNAENKARVKSATLYPKIVVGAIIIAVIILMNFVVPRFAAMYASFKIDLPLPTRILILLSGVFSAYWYYLFIFVSGVYGAFRFYLTTVNGRRQWDRLRLGFPIFGPIILKATLSRFCRVLGALYRSGLPILQSLDISSRAIENTAISAEVKAIEGGVRAGKSLSEPMTKTAYFPPLIIQMTAVGEETGNLDAMLDKAAQYYETEVDSAIRNLTTTIEPILLAFIFGMVLFLALAIFLPMWDILKVVKR